MVKVYVRKIVNGKLTIDEVPSIWRKKVAAELAALSEEERALMKDAS